MKVLNQPHKGREKYSIVHYGIGDIRMLLKNAEEIQIGWCFPARVIFPTKECSNPTCKKQKDSLKIKNF